MPRVNLLAVVLLLPALACSAMIDSASASSGDTIRVPDDYPTVLAAVDAAQTGDTVLVGPGTWSHIETRTVIVGGIPRLITGCAFPRRGVSIIGSGMDQTVLDPCASRKSHITQLSARSGGVALPLHGSERHRPPPEAGPRGHPASPQATGEPASGDSSESTPRESAGDDPPRR